MPLLELLGEDSAFDPADIKAMSMALEDACKALNVNGDVRATEALAIRIIELARQGERSRTKLRNRVLAEAKAGIRL